MGSGSSRPSPSCGLTPPRPPRRPVTPRRVRAIDVSAASRGVPVRTCVGCRQRRASAELARVTRALVDGVYVVFVGGPSRGRGAWLCRRYFEECLESAVRRRGFERAWRTKLSERDHDNLRAAVRRAEEYHRHG